MNSITKLLLFSTLILIMCVANVPAMAQERGIVKDADSDAPKSFSQLLSDIGMSFNFPDSFKEIKVPATEALPFNYGMALPGAEFEVWFRALTQKDSEKLLADKNIHVPSTDSVFVSLAQDQLLSFSSEKNYLRRNLPAYILRRYNADAGATYLLSINDTRLTKHYKYALLTAIQKNQSGVVLAVCFTNDKGPDFFRTMNMASGCLRFRD